MASNSHSNRNPQTQARKVMVVADPTRESAGALQYALCHAVLEQDELILLHVETPASWRNALTTFLKMPSLSSTTTASLDVGGASNGGGGGGAAAAAAATGGGAGDQAGDQGGVDFLEEMKNACRIALPKMRVRALKVEIDGKDRATTILSHTINQGVDVVVIGQKRSISSTLLGYTRPGGSLKGARMIDTAEYLIQNSPCTCVAVQRKGQNGGYVLNTKTHRNFWLLA